MLISQLNDLNILQSTLLPHLNALIPDWNALGEFVPAIDSQVDLSLIAKTVKQGDARDLLSVKKALDRNAKASVTERVRVAAGAPGRLLSGETDARATINARRIVDAATG